MSPAEGVVDFRAVLTGNQPPRDHNPEGAILFRSKKMNKVTKEKFYCLNADFLNDSAEGGAGPKNTYRFDTLVDRLTKFYEIPVRVIFLGACTPDEHDFLVMRHKAEKLAIEELFLLAYTEEFYGDSYHFDLLDRIIMERGASHEQHRAFAAGLTVTDEKPGLKRAAA
jgi:hypothetical protein